MDKLQIQEVVVVEGKYDLNTLKQLIDGIVITTDGFGIFNDKEKIELIRRMAEKRGVVILTDSDGAGFMIRNHLKSCLPKEQVKHAYIPDVYGKESRKRTRSKEGKLGVEGMCPEVLHRALIKAGATINEHKSECHDSLTKADLFSLGLSGTANSKMNRQKLMKALELPEHLSPNALLDVLNAMFERSAFLEFWNEIEK